MRQPRRTERFLQFDFNYLSEEFDRKLSTSTVLTKTLTDPNPTIGAKILEIIVPEMAPAKHLLTLRKTAGFVLRVASPDKHVLRETLYVYIVSAQTRMPRTTFVLLLCDICPETIK